MKPLLTALLAALFLGSGLHYAAGLAALPVPRDPPPAPPSPPPPPSPTPPMPPPKPGDKRCGMPQQHRPHLWTDKAGLVFQCDGVPGFRPPGDDPLPPKPSSPRFAR
ncbi:hypothetical protein [Prosthecobacter sp.]|uniref:hypothetical protein n=1 Tax=Prosthecobacter sp. TaxID=1965333 RepID=UPI002ABB2A5C|nr:hypothetical protein [Prosthecobacter sp.]MDZ4403645.1 hypothetical protein [Prosthecobacter sp.]